MPKTQVVAVRVHNGCDQQDATNIVDILMNLSARLHEAPETGPDIHSLDVALGGRHAAAVSIGI